ncbi:spore cortex biosynthesis protein YabQ [Halobacillus shinanisalinarum]|uniref:Spore cortex biosynthesis protein YabQ n=1 Tax=Halobacillus shinanisalinarum TaxID=2932258 RepID=A0ABY4GTA3_9BACI|nr:spore cortex biosynthesis protein YabQ [Halobacillus shinanisalinarum]UOQ91363.1 spore cortex biosynthesis protein YabQ [Halobacillus shinanisalinarum]
MTLTAQFMTMIAMISGGIYIGAAVDTFERLFYKRNKKSWLELVWQLAFWVIQAALLFFLLFIVNYGELRLYVFVAILCGYAAYRGLLQPGYKKILEHVINVATKLITFFLRLFNAVIIWPIRTIILLITSLLFAVYKVFYKCTHLLFLVVLYPFLLVFRAIWKLLPIKAKKNLNKTAGFWVKIKNTINKWKDRTRK